jgi:hypothetical protein
VRSKVRFDPVSLASGAVIAALGALLLLDSAGALRVSVGWMAMALTGAVGAILVLSGLMGRNGRNRSEGD